MHSIGANMVLELLVIMWMNDMFIIYNIYFSYMPRSKEEKAASLDLVQYNVDENLFNDMYIFL